METGIVVAMAVLAAAGVGLFIAARTRWLQSDTLRKCVMLSVIVHMVLAVVAASVGGLSPASWGRADAGRMTMVVVVAEDPGDVPSDDGLSAANEAAQDDGAAERAEAEVEAVTATSLPAIDAASADPVPLLDVVETRPEAAAPAAKSADASAADTLASTSAANESERRDPYALRREGRRSAAAAARGGSRETEQAVAAGLGWLSRMQSSDGRWDAARHGAGLGKSPQGHQHDGIGAKSDTGVTGLAVLSFLGAGSTHQSGPHAAEVRRGIDYLLSKQSVGGSFAGDAEFFAALYCHGMATIAVAEASAMTGDERLREPLARAVGHTLSMQNPSTGGWRYAAGDRGDTSQLGWQVMALQSARNAGMPRLEGGLQRAAHFLASVSSGSARGLAAYRPGERPSVAMTAEAAFCRLLLGLDPAHPSITEATLFLEASDIDASPFNAYSWYYATLAMFHAGGPGWDRWNERLQRTLLPLQRRGGDNDGSWDPDPVWGGHGGRVFTTALSVLSLEVYYRYLPMSGGRNAAVATVGGASGI